jgi:phosphoribosyl 1,2-cyclic phosphate phosphodiesterase
MKITMLGCGGSQGVPSAAGDWGRCDPTDPRNRRRRVSILIETADAAGSMRRLVIDTTPDFRGQMLDAGVKWLDAVLYTHAHADHINGLDDLRSFNRAMSRTIPIWASETTLADIRQRFAYAIEPPQPTYYRPTLEPHVFAGKFEVAGLEITPFDQDHGFSRSTGFRIGDFAYSTDVVTLSEDAFEILAGVDVWIVDCVRLDPHPTHSHLARTLEWIARIKPRRAILTHMDGTLDFASLASLLPPGVEPGRDGLIVEL